MSKYIIEIKPEYEDSFKGLMILGAKDSNLFVDVLAVENLEQYTPDDVEKVYDKAYRDGYNKGFEDGKAVHDKGCEGCKYANVAGTHEPCVRCSNSYGNQWTAKDDEIEVGDEVIWTEDEDIVIIVTLIYTSNGIEWCDGICRDGKVYQILTEHARKTGRHFDIASILEAIKT